MKETDIAKVKEAARIAKLEPSFCQPVIVEGFRFDIYWKSYWGGWQYSIQMMFDPGWGHCHYYITDEESKVVEIVNEAIAEHKKLWTSGGRYPEDYYSRS